MPLGTLTTTSIVVAARAYLMRYELSRGRRSVYEHHTRERLIAVKNHFLLIGFSCTGKTSLGRSALRDANIIDSDDEVLKWIERNTRKRYAHIFEIYMRTCRDDAISLIERAEESLILEWIDEPKLKTISLGPGFPLRRSWPRLRAVSFVVLFRRSAEGIYDSLKERREKVFKDCPEAKDYDNWDVGVMVDEYRTEYTRACAIGKISALLAERQHYYQDNDDKVDTDKPDAGTQLQDIWKEFAAGRGGATDPTGQRVLRDP
jgi:shikimate kinase